MMNSILLTRTSLSHVPKPVVLLGPTVDPDNQVGLQSCQQECEQTRPDNPVEVWVDLSFVAREGQF